MNRSILRIIPAATVAIVASVALAGCGSGEKKPAAEQAPATSTQPEPPTTTEELPQPIRPAEKRWMAHLQRYSNRIQRDARLGGTITQASMRRSAKLYAGCSKALDWAGDPGRFEPADKPAQRACDRLKKAADLLELAIASSDEGGSVVAGTPEEKQFDRALHGSFEAAGNAQYDLQRALERAQAIERSIKS